MKSLLATVVFNTSYVHAKYSNVSLKVGYGICETPADFEKTQLKWSYPLSFNANSDSTHSKYMDAKSCMSINTDVRERARLARLEFRVVF